MTTPAQFSTDYERYTEAVEALIKVGGVVLERGVASPVKVAELDEWKPFRGPVGLPPSAVAPRGLGTGQLESLWRYAAWMPEPEPAPEQERTDISRER